MAGPKKPQTKPSAPLQWASRLDADRRQERQQQAETSWQEAAQGGREKKAFLEGDTRSYMRPEKTERESFMDEQQKMTETAAQFSPEGSEDEAGEQPGSPDGSGARQRSYTSSEASQEAEEERIIQEEQAQEEELQIAQRFQRIQQLELQAQQRMAQAADTEQQGANLILQTKKEWQNIRQFSEAASGVGIFLLILELNAQTLATLLNIKVPGLQKASKPRMVVTGCVDCAACFGQLAMWLPFIIVILIAWWMIENPLQAFLTWIGL